MRPAVANFADLIKITMLLNKTTLKDSIKVKKVRKNIYENDIVICISRYNKDLLMSADLKGCIM